MALRRSAVSALRPLRTTFRPPPSPSLSQSRLISAYGYEQTKALVFKDYGEPEDILHLHTHSISPAHSNNVTVRFLAAPINPADINQLQGVYPSKPTFTNALGTPKPVAVGGNEGVAEVIAVGEKVKSLAKGDWVIMKGPGFGTWRTHAQAEESLFMKIEDKSGITPIQVGTVSVNPCTAYRMLCDFVPLDHGDWIIQNGANSGVGRAAIQLARLWGYKTINVIRKRDNPDEMDKMVQELHDLGADIVVSDGELQDRGIREKVMQWTNGGRERIRLGLNCVGGKPATAMAKLLSPGGHLVTYGAMSKRPLELPASLLIFKNINFNGFWVSRYSEQNPDGKKRTVEHILDLTRNGKFKDMPFQEIPWEWETQQETLVGAVRGTLEGFRSGKGVFVFKNT